MGGFLLSSDSRKLAKIAAGMSFPRPQARRFWLSNGGPARAAGGNSAHYGSKVAGRHGPFPHFGGRGMGEYPRD